MSFSILNPSNSEPSLRSLCAMAIMAKAPRPGKVKTRLSPPLTAEQAAIINSRFLMDTTANLADLAKDGTCSGVISYTPAGDELLFEGILPQGYRLIPQRGDGFGERLLLTAQDLFACGFGAVCLIDSDSPTVPRAAFEMAVNALRKPGDRIVLGPSRDGGYYLIGMKQPHRELFENITWSTSMVCEETIEVVRRLGLELVRLPLWYDVDDAATLAILRNELLEGCPPEFAAMPGFDAGRTRAFLKHRDRSA